MLFNTDGEGVTSNAVIPFQDSQWHQAGVVFDNGEVTFYLDGSPLGTSLTLPSVTAIPAQTLDWFLIEDPQSLSNRSEYFDGGDYDDAALWYRALSPNEMQQLYLEGVTVPEPGTLGIAAVALLVVATGRRT